MLYKYLDELKTIMRKQHSDQQEEISCLKLLINQQNDKLESQEKEINELKSIIQCTNTEINRTNNEQQRQQNTIEQVSSSNESMVKSIQRMNTFLNNYGVVLYTVKNYNNNPYATHPVQFKVDLRDDMQIIPLSIDYTIYEIDCLRLCKMMGKKITFKLGYTNSSFKFRILNEFPTPILFMNFCIDAVIPEHFNSQQNYYTHYYIIYLAFEVRFITEDDVDITETLIKQDFDRYNQKLQNNQLDKRFYANLDDFMYEYT